MAEHPRLTFAALSASDRPASGSMIRASSELEIVSAVGAFSVSLIMGRFSNKKKKPQKASTNKKTKIKIKV
jgi:hypothetical protein